MSPHLYLTNVTILSMSEGSSEIPKSIEREQVPKTSLLIFGIGPVVDAVTRNVPESNGNNPVADVNIWSKDIARAASIIRERGDADKIFILGGKTGGEKFYSESKIIQTKLSEYNVPEKAVVIEEKSQDTIANLINLYTMLGSKTGENLPEFNILGADFHTMRIQILMKLLQIPYKEVFSAESILKLHAMETEDAELSLTLRHMTNGNDSLFLRDKLHLPSSKSDRIGSFFQAQKGTETKDFVTRKLWEGVLIRELLEYPESWLSRINEIQNHEQKIKIVTHAEKIYPGILDRYNIKIETDTPETLTNKLAQIKKNPLSDEKIDQWMKEEMEGHWPDVVSQRFSTLTESNKIA